MGSMGLIFIPVLVRCLLGPLGLSGLMMTSTLELIDAPNSPTGRYNPPLAANLPHHSPHPLSPAHPLIHAICDITVVVKKLLKIQQCWLAT